MKTYANSRIYTLGGGTFSHVRSHLALAAPAFGGTARRIHELLLKELGDEIVNAKVPATDYIPPSLVLTKMANHYSDLVTNEDVNGYVSKIIADPKAKMVFFNVALCDFDGEVFATAGDGVTPKNGLYVDSGKYAERLKTADGAHLMKITPAEKIIGRIRRERKDIFLIGFKTTTGATEDEQYLAGLNLLKANSINLVLANDTKTRRNMIITPEEARYCVTENREVALQTLVKMAMARGRLTFTRSTVVPGDSISWSSDFIPDNLRKVVNHCIERGAYKPFRGSTAGHFAVKVSDDTFVTSKRKTNFNHLNDVGMVMVRSVGDDEVRAYGAKPSVGGQSQRIVFREHPDYDCIVHFHCPRKPLAHDAIAHTDLYGHVPVRPQQWLECGSHECGKNTSDGLRTVADGIKVVYLDNHGPNIVFRKDVDPQKVISFIEDHFDLAAKTGGLVA